MSRKQAADKTAKEGAIKGAYVNSGQWEGKNIIKAVNIKNWRKQWMESAKDRFTHDLLKNLVWSHILKKTQKSQLIEIFGDFYLTKIQERIPYVKKAGK